MEGRGSRVGAGLHCGRGSVRKATMPPMKDWKIVVPKRAP